MNHGKEMTSGPGLRAPHSRLPSTIRSAVGALAWLLLVGPASADHSLPPVRGSGPDWMAWLLVTGGLLAVGLAAWAFLAPEKSSGSGGPGEPER